MCFCIITSLNKWLTTTNIKGLKMPYINQAMKKEIVEEIKKVMPKDWKASFRVSNHSTLTMVVKSAPLNLSDLGRSSEVYPYSSFNEYYINEVKNETLKKTIQSILDALNGKVKIVTEDSDYGNVPNYYTHLVFGTREKPFVSTLSA